MTLPSTTPGPVATDPAPTGSGADRVCATCGGYVRLVGADQSVKVWSHVRTPRSPHQIACVMGMSQWDRWAR